MSNMSKSNSPEMIARSAYCHSPQPNPGSRSQMYPKKCGRIATDSAEEISTRGWHGTRIDTSALDSSPCSMPKKCTQSDNGKSQTSMSGKIDLFNQRELSIQESGFGSMRMSEFRHPSCDSGSLSMYNLPSQGHVDSGSINLPNQTNAWSIRDTVDSGIHSTNASYCSQCNSCSSVSCSGQCVNDSGLKGNLSQQLSELSLQDSLLDNKESVPLGSGSSYSTFDNPAEFSIPEDQFWHQAFHTDEEDGDTKLHLAIIHGAAEVYNIIQLAASPCCLDVQNYRYRQSPLHLAALTGQAMVARKLLAWGATVDLRDHRGDTPLHIACRQGSLDCVKVLTTPLEYQEVRHTPYSVPCQRVPQDMSLMNYNDESCLHLAAERGCFDIVQHLVQFCGADTNLQETKAGSTVLHHAVLHRNKQLVGNLLQLKGVINLEAVTFSGRSPLQLAIECEFPEIADMLCNAGASMENVETDGSLDIAMDESDDESVEDGLNYDDLSFRGVPVPSCLPSCAQPVVSEP